MRKYIDELINDARMFCGGIHHSYLVYRKFKLNENMNICERLLFDSSADFNSTIRNIFYSNIDKAEIIKVFDYEEGFNYKIVKMEYDKYNLVFMCSPLTIILVNFFYKETIHPKDENICFFEVNSELKHSCVHDFPYNGEKFTVINTHEPFIDFCNDSKTDLNLDVNMSFWSDFESYINGCPRRGRYSYFQIGRLVIVYKYEKIIKKEWKDIQTGALALTGEDVF